MMGFSDSDWRGDKSDRRSTTGYLFKLFDAPTSWCSKKQPVVALSSCEAEYIVGAFVACQAIWIDSLMKEIQVEPQKLVQILIDNKSAINLAKNPISHGRSKHIETRFHFLRDKVSKDLIEVVHYPTEVQVVDVLTKSVRVERFVHLRMDLGVVELLD